MAKPTGCPSFLSYLLEEVDPVAAGKRDVEIGHAEPLSLHEGVLPRERIPLAVLLRQVVADVGDVGQPRREEPGIVHLQADDVVPGLRHQLGSQLGRHLHALDVIGAHVDPGQFREALAELGELGVRGRRVVHGRQEADFPGRPGAGRATRGQDPGEPGRRAHEAAAGQGRGRGGMRRRVVHGAPPADGRGRAGSTSARARASCPFWSHEANRKIGVVQPASR